MGLYTVGLDVHSRHTVFAIQDEEGKLVRQGHFPTTSEGVGKFAGEAQLAAGTRVGLESGSQSFFMARLLWKAGFVPVVVDAREVRAKAHRPTQKCDKRDAVEICEGIRKDIYRAIVHVPPPEVEAIRLTLARRRHFVRIKTMQVNAAKHALRSVGHRSLYRSLSQEPGWRRLLTRAQATVPSLVSTLEMHFAVWKSGS